MTEQKQSVGAGGEAYQAKGNISVYNGATPEQMAEIIGAITKQLGHFTHEARVIADERCEELKREILDELAKPGAEASSKAFRDPDYQYVLGSAIESFARKGDAALKAELVRLLMERAAHDTESRISYILNEAIRLAGRLTPQDRAVLAVIFFVKCVMINAADIHAVYTRHQLMLDPYVNLLPTTPGSFEYLASIGCISIERVADHFPLDDHLNRRYGNLFPQKMIPGPSLPGQSEPDMMAHPPAAAEVLSAFKSNVPALVKLEAVWQSAFYRHSIPTAVGKALAHSILTGDGKLDAALEVFVN